MQKSLSAAVTLMAAGMMLVGSGYAQTQQAPAATPKTAPATTTPKVPAKKAAAATAAKSAAPAGLETRKDKFSYALGMNIGSGLGANLKKQSVDYDVDLVIQGLKDAMTGAKMRLTEPEAQAVLQEVQTELRKAQQEKAEKASAANKTEGEAFLAANKGKEGVVTLPSGLQYKILKEGTGPKPAATDTVVCNYKGTLINGTEFDSSYKRGQPATFPVGGVIKGWTEALQLMPVGSKWQLFIPSGLAYGERGTGADIGPNATLIFEVELLSIQEKPKEPPKEPAKELGKEPPKDQSKEPPKDQEKK
jgi:FKBP-type peptidyl-prolyl cis-trans isomerase FklB